MDHNTQTEPVNLWRVVWAHKGYILLASAFGAIATEVFALAATPIYRAQAVVVEIRDTRPADAAARAGDLGSLMNRRAEPLVAIDSAHEAQEVLHSHHLIEEFIRRNHLIETLLPNTKRQPTLALATRRFRERVLSIREDKLRGTTTVAIDWIDPALAASWANGFVALADELVRARAQDTSQRNLAYLESQLARIDAVELQEDLYGVIETEAEKLVLTNSRPEYALAIVDPAVAPEFSIAPQRSLMVLLGTAAGFYASVTGILWRCVMRRP